MTTVDNTLNHPDYNTAKDDLLLVRECMSGESELKRSVNRKIYIPDPRYIDGKARTAQAIAEYNSYLEGAEYDDFVSPTVSAWVGLLNLSKCEFELPPVIDYLENNADGDGTSLTALMSMAASNVFQTKYHGLLVEYGMGLPDIQTNTLTRSEQRDLGIQVSIKSYKRESIRDWGFTNIGGVKKLSYLKLSETVEVRGENNTLSTATNYLTLALDDDGYYYQKKDYQNAENKNTTEIIYPEANRNKLTEIPFVFLMDEETEPGFIPRKMGPIYPIAKKAIARMRTSADLNRSLKITGVPGVFTKGWKVNDDELFVQLNEGRRNIAFGASNNLPNDVTVDIVQMAGSGQPLFEKMDRNQEEAKALGARFDFQKNKNQTATESNNIKQKETAMLINAASEIEYCFEKILYWASMFEGDEQETQVTINKDFSNVKLSPEERKAVRDDVTMGLISKEQAIQIYIDGGILPKDSLDVIGELSPISATG